MGGRLYAGPFFIEAMNTPDLDLTGCFGQTTRLKDRQLPGSGMALNWQIADFISREDFFYRWHVTCYMDGIRR